MIGITIRKNIGIGDAVQFSSLPENYFRATGKKLVDQSSSWIFDHNPYVLRNVSDSQIRKSYELWNFGHRNKWDWPRPRESHQPAVYLSNAEPFAALLGVPVTLNRPRLYYREDFPFERRKKILLHVDGKSHGRMPEHVIEHVVKKYRPTGELFQIGLAEDSLGIPKILTRDIWELAAVISESRMLIGMDSGPSWIAACYPDVIVKKLRTNRTPDQWRNWVPLEIRNIHSHWDDRCHMIFNESPDDTGAFQSYRKI